MKYLLSLLFVGCAFDDTNVARTNDTRDTLERQQLEKAYESLTGTYSGEFRRGTPAAEVVEPVQLKVLWVNRQTGRDSENNPTFTPVLLARLSRSQSLCLDSIFEGQYNRKSSTLNFTGQNASTPVGFCRDLLNLSGQRQGTQLILTVTRNDGSASQVTFDRTSTVVDFDNDAEKAKEFRDLLRSFAGKFSFTAESSGPLKKFSGTFELQYNEILFNNQVYPSLIGTYARTGSTFSPTVNQVIIGLENRSGEWFLEMDARNSSGAVEKIYLKASTKDPNVWLGQIIYSNQQAQVQLVRRAP